MVGVSAWRKRMIEPSPHVDSFGETRRSLNLGVLQMTASSVFEAQRLSVQILRIPFHVMVGPYFSLDEKLGKRISIFDGGSLPAASPGACPRPFFSTVLLQLLDFSLEMIDLDLECIDIFITP
ncbi:hypothetical protein CBS63078_4444 [Aspergillus niger]|nr:hypothetical protein CBS115989_8458 [Aspergillus niger]KAI2837137.1 hypothetical protein CBS11350_8910 [Aspergillus niger]KAI2845123.1 hypothetical protein CBS11232_7835 [Aspergillus niger]KAI2859681.1 hypothetical protein CBS12448_5696 [Aspergillus niger]KAI2871923.1 hypothetical protein CBS115988_8276 [Aspergillus niger]